MKNLSEREEWLMVIGGLFGFLICFIFCVFIDVLDKRIHKKPDALDVYRGKTELEVTSVNGVPIDSTVIFKK